MSNASGPPRSSHPWRGVLEALVGDAPFTYVDCGARSGKLPRPFRTIPGSRYIGFDADAAECARLNASARRGHTYVAAFLGSGQGRRRFRMTTNPACSSLLEPNFALLDSFGALRDEFRVEQEIEVDTVALDDCLHANGIHSADFLELDTQGTELEILTGSQRVLTGDVVGVKVEVEFAPMYVGQALFADVDAFLRSHGFQLFDLSRYRVRRPGVDAAVPTRGQLLWGHALYLRHVDTLPEQRAARLAVVAAITGVSDFAAEVFTHLAATASREELREAARHAVDLLQNGGGIGAEGFEASRGCSIWRD